MKVKTEQKKYTVQFEVTAEQAVKIKELLYMAIDFIQGIDDRYDTANIILNSLPRVKQKVVFENE